MAGRPTANADGHFEIVAQAKRRKPPTQQEIKNLVALLNDFGITVTVPTFTSHHQMDSFRRSMIARAI